MLEENNIFVALLPPNTTDLLQPLDITVNKSAENYLWQQFQDWYSKKISEQLEGQDMANVMLEPVDLSLPIMIELGAKWLTDVGEYLASNPQFIVNGFFHSGISHALDCSSKNIPEPLLTRDDDNEDSDYQADFGDEDNLDNEEDTDSDKGDPDNDEEEYLNNGTVGISR